MANEKYPIKSEWTKYYKALEVINKNNQENSSDSSSLF